MVSKKPTRDRSGKTSSMKRLSAFRKSQFKRASRQSDMRLLYPLTRGARVIGDRDEGLSSHVIARGVDTSSPRLAPTIDGVTGPQGRVPSRPTPPVRIHMPIPIRYIPPIPLQAIATFDSGSGVTGTPAVQAYGGQIGNLGQDADDAEMSDATNMHTWPGAFSAGAQGNALINPSDHASQAPSSVNPNTANTASSPGPLPLFFDDSGIWQGLGDPIGGCGAQNPFLTETYSLNLNSDSSDSYRLPNANVPPLPNPPHLFDIGTAGRSNAPSSHYADTFKLNLNYGHTSRAPVPLYPSALHTGANLNPTGSNASLNSRLALALSRTMASIDNTLHHRVWSASGNTAAPHQPSANLDPYAHLDHTQLNHAVQNLTNPSFPLHPATSVASLSFVPNEYPLPSPATHPLNNSCPSPVHSSATIDNLAQDRQSESDALQRTLAELDLGILRAQLDFLNALSATLAMALEGRQPSHCRNCRH